MTMLELRHAKNLTQHDLSHRSGVSLRTIVAIERAGHIPTPPLQRRLLTALGRQMIEAPTVFPRRSACLASRRSS